jgi:putative PIN family toxin of toxin-antitoxin system
LSEPIGPVVVYDCMIYLQAASRDAGPSFACMGLLDRDLVQLHVSAEIISEVKDVLTRPETMRRFPLLTADRVNEFLQRVEDKAIHTKETPKHYSLPRDPKDEPYINLAIEVSAEYLVSRDKDLLDLMDESTPEGKSFRSQFPNLTIIGPVEFLRLLTEERAAKSATEADNSESEQGLKPTPDE